MVEKLYENAIHEDEALAEKLNEQEYEQTGDGIECGCCFSTYPFVSAYLRSMDSRFQPLTASPHRTR